MFCPENITHIWQAGIGSTLRGLISFNFTHVQMKMLIE